MEHSAKINLVSVSLDVWSIMARAWLQEHNFVFVFVSVFDQEPPNLPQCTAHLVSFPIRWFLYCPYGLSLLIIVPVFYQQRGTGYGWAMPFPTPMHHTCYRTNGLFANMLMEWTPSYPSCTKGFYKLGYNCSASRLCLPSLNGPHMKSCPISKLFPYHWAPWLFTGTVTRSTKCDCVLWDGYFWHTEFILNSSSTVFTLDFRGSQLQGCGCGLVGAKLFHWGWPDDGEHDGDNGDGDGDDDVDDIDDCGDNFEDCDDFVDDVWPAGGVGDPASPCGPSHGLCSVWTMETSFVKSKNSEFTYSKLQCLCLHERSRQTELFSSQPGRVVDCPTQLICTWILIWFCVPWQS